MSFLSELSDASLFALIALNADTLENAPIYIEACTNLKKYLLDYYGSEERLRRRLSPQINMLLHVDRQLCKRRARKHQLMAKQKQKDLQWLQMESEKNKQTKAQGNIVSNNILVKYRNSQWVNEHVVDVKSDRVQMSGGHEWFCWDRGIWESGKMNFTAEPDIYNHKPL